MGGDVATSGTLTPPCVTASTAVGDLDPCSVLPQLALRGSQARSPRSRLPTLRRVCTFGGSLRHTHLAILPPAEPATMRWLRGGQTLGVGASGRRRRADPVFVDRSGRRWRLFALAGSACGCGLLLVTAALLTGFTSGGPGVLPHLPSGGEPGVAVVPAPSTSSPTESTSPSGTDRPGRQSSPTTGSSTAGSPTASSSANGRRNGPIRTPSHPGKPK
jgi:hypothetical protein